MELRMHSATVVVSDYVPAYDFYVNKLGWEAVQDQPSPDGSRWLVVRRPGGETGLAIVRVGDFGMNDAKPGDYSGISLVTPDVNQAYQELLAKGVTFSQPPQPMPWGTLGTWFSDPDGNSFFLTEE
ncbi:MAG TPA: VOC family protein [Thermomicrobiaceae bacterium]|nr:VOC family protein [Thermomicrobiaceae bacterium]